MRHAGLVTVADTESLSAIGFAEILSSVPRHVTLAGRVRREWDRRRPDAVVLVDYPGFHLRLARSAARRDIPVLYYVAPQLWAWHAGRAARMRKTVSHVAAILPFEEAFFRGLGIRATFVGHPLRDRPPEPRELARQRIGAGDRPVVALFPGSRAAEIRRMGPLFDDVARRLRIARPDALVITGRRDGSSIRDGVPAEIAVAAADAALCKSGTITLQAALAGVPMVIAYRTSPATHWLARRLVRVPFIGLPNILLGRSVVPELVQDEATPDTLARGVLSLLDRDEPARRQREAFQALPALLGPPGVAGRVAELALEVTRE